MLSSAPERHPTGEQAMLATRRRVCTMLGSTFAAALAPLRVGAVEPYPSRPVQLIVPYAPGGSGDLLVRLLGNALSKRWGQQVIVENKPGAGGLIGTEAAAKSTHDGYTLYLATDGPLTIAATLHRHLPYDWKRDFAPISMMAVGYQILLSSPKLPATNLNEFITLAKQHPGKYNFASIGVGSAPHLAAELFLSMTGLKLTHVPYAGSSQQCLAALISGDVAMFMVGTSTAVPFVKAGTVRGLAVTAPRRLDSLPNVPTFLELEMPKMDYSLWFAIEAPSGTPPPIIQKVHDDIAEVVSDAAYRKALHIRGFEAQSDTPEQLGAFLQNNYLQLKPLIEYLGLRVD
jgi:tripartite-type tricarboxylate transporter receptor subunit TctC